MTWQKEEYLKLIARFGIILNPELSFLVFSIFCICSVANQSIKLCFPESSKIGRDMEKKTLEQTTRELALLSLAETLRPNSHKSP